MMLFRKLDCAILHTKHFDHSEKRLSQAMKKRSIHDKQLTRLAREDHRLELLRRPLADGLAVGLAAGRRRRELDIAGCHGSLLVPSEIRQAEGSRVAVSWSPSKTGGAAVPSGQIVYIAAGFPPPMETRRLNSKWGLFLIVMDCFDSGSPLRKGAASIASIAGRSSEWSCRCFDWGVQLPKGSCLFGRLCSSTGGSSFEASDGAMGEIGGRQAAAHN